MRCRCRGREHTRGRGRNFSHSQLKVGHPGLHLRKFLVSFFTSLVTIESVFFFKKNQCMKGKILTKKQEVLGGDVRGAAGPPSTSIFTSGGRNSISV